MPDPADPAASAVPSVVELRTPSRYDGPPARVGIIGGSGLYSLLAEARTVEVRTPWGLPSDPLVVGQLGEQAVAFLPRHGGDHRHAPHRVNYRANLWALRHVGVRQVLAPCAVGSLRPELGPGTVVVPDQVVDRTWGRAHTYFEATGAVVHVPFADPYCPTGRAAVLAIAREAGLKPVDGGTLVVVNGPRFSSRAESRWHAAAGWSVVGMTTMPEAALARELAVCYTSIALVTDLDAGVAAGQGVTQAEVFRAFADNVSRVRDLLHRVVPRLPTEPTGCPCPDVHAGARLPFPLP